MTNIEKEIKILINENQYESIKKSTEGLSGRDKLQINHYFDTDDFALCSGGLMLRIREKMCDYIITLKVLKSLLDNIRTAEELEFTIDSVYVQVLMDKPCMILSYYPIIRETILKRLNKPMDKLAYKGSMSTLRTTFSFGELCFELDKNEYLDINDYELECEIPDLDSVKKIDCFLRYWLISRQTTVKSKYERFIERLISKNSVDSLTN